MLSFLAKAAFAGVTVALVTLVARRNPAWGGLLAALPLTSVLAFILLWLETRDANAVADLSSGVLAFIVPTIPFFIALPMMLRAGVPFWTALAIGVAGMIALFAISFWLLARAGIAA